MTSLDVIVQGRLVGTLHNTEPLAFAFSDDCLVGLLRNPFADVIPLASGDIATPAVLAFFENLLPEGDQRRSLAQLHQVSTVFGLLSKAVWDSAGEIVLRPTGMEDKAPFYSPKSWADIARFMDGSGPPNESSTAAISGAQYKLLLSLDDQGNPLLPVGSTPTTHILKPDIRRVGQKIWASAINETIVMRMAAKCGLPVATVDYVASVKSCLVRRYDRVMKDGKIGRIGQSDLCQQLKIPSTVKYETDGGPDFASCYAHVKAVSNSPIVDCENLIRWIFFNLYTGNNDSHAKNISMLQDGRGLRLAPFYDLMCTSSYAGFSRHFAFKIGNTFKPGDMDTTQLCALAASIGVSDKFMLRIAADMSKKIIGALQPSIQELRAVMGPAEEAMAERLAFEIMGICKKRTAKFLGTP